MVRSSSRYMHSLLTATVTICLHLDFFVTADIAFRHVLLNTAVLNPCFCYKFVSRKASFYLKFINYKLIYEL